jgi:hypothetical protein
VAGGEPSFGERTVADSTGPAGSGRASIFDRFTEPIQPIDLPTRADTRTRRSAPDERRRTVLWIATPAVALVVVIVLSFLYFSGRGQPATGAPPPTPGPTVPFTPGQPSDTPSDLTSSELPPSNDNTTDEAGQLSAVESILDHSVDSRSELHQALQTACSDPSAAVGSVDDVVSRRTDEVTQAQGLDLSAVPNGVELGTDLVALLQTSSAADSAYADYVHAVDEDGCHAGKSAYNRGNDLSATAQSAKSTFFAVWTPLADEFNLPPHSTNDV